MTTVSVEVHIQGSFMCERGLFFNAPLTIPPLPRLCCGQGPPEDGAAGGVRQEAPSGRRNKAFGGWFAPLAVG